MLTPSIPIPDSGYLRTFEAEIDNHSETEIRVRGVMSDHRVSLAHTWILRTPQYEVIEACAEHLIGEPSLLDPELKSRYGAIRGVRIERGFSQRIRSELGGLTGHQEHLFLAIEMARVGQQVYKFPEDFTRKFLPILESLPEGPGREARLAWEKDRAYMPDLANSCFTYRDASAPLFLERSVVCTFGSSVTTPKAGEKRIFWRNKTLHIWRRGGPPVRFHCQNSMQDTIHDILVEFSLSANGRISRPYSRGLRLPYSGICEEPQFRTPGLDGKQVTRDFVRLIADEVGGSSGCTHLFDLTVDCLRLFRFLD